MSYGKLLFHSLCVSLHTRGGYLPVLTLPFYITLVVCFIVLSFTKGLLSLEIASVTTTSGRDTVVPYPY